MGQAQKLVNMMLKYLYAYYKCEEIDDLKEVVKFFHAPIDRYVLNASLGTETFTDNKKNKIPWSQIISYKEYLDVQKEIRAKIDANPLYQAYKNKTAFEWELAEWPF